ncbi:S-adenosyl-L-methionine-dependent methyltransferase [Auricularia subglabra TFB-10046 SS5]|nr:S-adenosyl-L-methionine-dependent methyltransferase [Auricularia subglabra TFB-10046 SS5]
MLDSHSESLYALLLAAGIALVVVVYRTSRDPYRLFHLELNALDGEATPRTEWLNMGMPPRFLKPAQVPLALRVAKAAHCKPGGHVLDCGHGCGDSLLLHLTSDKLPQPATLVGITTVGVQYERAWRRVKSIDSDVQVHLYHGDAVNRQDGHGNSPGHPFSSPQNAYTSILAIDCAYHFETRALFLKQCFEHLAPGGWIALADLVVDPLPPFHVRVWLSALTGIRLANMVTPTDYIATLRSIGYDEVQLQDISEHVFTSFIAFLKQRGGVWRAFTSVPSYWASNGGRFVIVGARRPP